MNQGVARVHGFNQGFDHQSVIVQGLCRPARDQRDAGASGHQRAGDGRAGGFNHHLRHGLGPREGLINQIANQALRREQDHTLAIKVCELEAPLATQGMISGQDRHHFGLRQGLRCDPRMADGQLDHPDVELLRGNCAGNLS